MVGENLNRYNTLPYTRDVRDPLLADELESTFSSRTFLVQGRPPAQRRVMLYTFVFVIFLLPVLRILDESLAEEIWEQDLSEEMRIGASTEGYDSVGLRCGAESMIVELKTTDDFTGVIYTQGSFHSKKSPCFLDPKHGSTFIMNIPLKKCKTLQDGDKYSNVLVIQHDDELVTPGDAAFTLECDFTKPRDLTVTADFTGSKKRPAKSSIALVDADPGRDRTKRAAYVESETDEVVFRPESDRKKKVEL